MLIGKKNLLWIKSYSNYGFPERPLALFNGAKKMVAAPRHYCVVARWHSFSHWRRLCGGSLCLHSFLGMKIKLNREKELEILLTICVGLLVVYFATKQQYRWLITLSILLGLVGIFSKFLTAKMAWAWTKLGEGMGFVMSKVILSVIFFLFLFPLSLLSKLFAGKKDNMQLKKTSSDSYYTTRNHTYEAKDLQNPW